MPGGSDSNRFQRCACVRGTSLGVLSAGRIMIMVIGLFDCGGGRVDMGDLPESSVSLNELSMLHQQWPPAILCHMVWLQQDLEVMRAEAKKRFRSTRSGSCSYCGTWIKCDMYRHVAKFHLDLAQCPGARCGRARHRIAWIMFGGRMMFLGSLSRPV